MHMRKSMCKIMEPCGIVCFAVPKFEVERKFRVNHCCLLSSLLWNSKHKLPWLSNPLQCSFESTVMIRSQKGLTSSADKPLLCVLFVRADKISPMKLYRILTSDIPFPYPNCSCANILMEFRETVTVLYTALQGLTICCQL